MKWKFSPLPADQVETEVTQRDHFNNDEVNLSETIVREAVQNSLDAAIEDENSKVKVSFQFIKGKKQLDTSFIKELFSEQLNHARAANIDLDDIAFEEPEVLIIEDFGTHGLTGSTFQKDDDNFSDFWRRHGKSHKSGTKRGRWGLGKLVYSTSSRLGVFFGLTKRSDDPNTYLMGQTVLNTRTVEDKLYPPHSFFADYAHKDDHLKRIPIPVQDEKIKSTFVKNFKLARANLSGLSIIIPFPDKSFNRDQMIGVAIANYFYPILTGQLELSFDDIEITKENIRSLALKYAENMFPQIDLLFDFIEEVYASQEDELIQLTENWMKGSVVGEKSFNNEDLNLAREKYNNGETVGISLPVSVRRKDSEPETSSFKVFIKKPFGLDKGLDIYVRGGLTLPAESKFKDRKALGAMIAENNAICDLLGDAENAAHTQWTMRTEKLSNNYIAPGPLVKSVKQSVISIYRLLAEVVEERNENALLDFFWYRNPQNTPKKVKKPKEPKPVPLIPKKPKKLQLIKTTAGFNLESGEGMLEEMLPFEQKIKVAYDVIKGNPFKKYSPHDFTVGSTGQIKVLEKEGVTIVKSAQNEWTLRIEKTEFKFSADGFDTNRDLVIRIPEGKSNVEEV